MKTLTLRMLDRQVFLGMIRDFRRRGIADLNTLWYNRRFLSVRQRRALVIVRAERRKGGRS